MNSLGGMYLGYGTGNSDFGHVDRTGDSAAEGSFGATGGSAAITANRCPGGCEIYISYYMYICILYMYYMIYLILYYILLYVIIHVICCF